MQAILAEIRLLYRYRTLLHLLVRRNLIVRYKRSVLGFLWTVLNPGLSMLVMTIVFSSLFRFQVPNYAVYVLSAYVIWLFFSQSTAIATPMILANGHLIKKVALPKTVFPLATVASGLVNLGFMLPPLLLITLFTHHPLRPAIFFVPIATLAMTCFTAGLALILSAAAAIFNDIQHIYGVIISLLYFLVPIMYPASIIPETRRWMLTWNPLYYLVETFRRPIFDGTLPPAHFIIVSFASGIVALVLGFWYFQRVEHLFLNYV